MSKPKSTRGGRRENQTGRPRLPDGEKRVKVAITMTREHWEATKGNRSAKVEQALGLLLGNSLTHNVHKKMKMKFIVKTETMGHYNHLVVVPLSELPQDSEVPDRLPLESHWRQFAGPDRPILESEMAVSPGHPRGYSFTVMPKPNTETTIAKVGDSEYNKIYAEGRMGYLISTVRQLKPGNRDGNVYFYTKKAESIAQYIDVYPLMDAIDKIK